jgi:hypothetical protein
MYIEHSTDRRIRVQMRSSTGLEIGQEVTTQLPVKPAEFSISGELDELWSIIVEIVDSICGLASCLQVLAPHNQLLGIDLDDLLDEGPDIQHVRDKFPAAKPELVHRLGLLNSDRRNRLKYWSKNRGHIGLQDQIPVNQPRIRSTGIPSSLGWTAIAATASAIDSGYKSMSQGGTLTVKTGNGDGTPAQDVQTGENTLQRTSVGDTQYDSGDSDTSATSYAVSIKSGLAGGVKVPTPPNGFYGGEPYECPYCFKTLSIKTEKGWK